MTTKRHQKQVVLLTNHHKLTASIVADVYKDCWEVELFFKALKQNLKVKTFVSTSSNDLGSLDRPALAQGASSSFSGRMVPVQPGCHAASKIFHLQGVARLAPTLLPHPAPYTRTDPVTTLALIWTSNRQ
ncbi:hypothetical protein DFAR_670001 [Desulfarculales bacterium]